MLIEELIDNLPYLGFLEGQLYKRILGCKLHSKMDRKLKSNLAQVQHRIHHCLMYIRSQINNGPSCLIPLTHLEWIEWYHNELSK